MLFSGGYKKEPVEWNWLKYWICPSKVGDENTKVAFLDVVLFFFFWLWLWTCIYPLSENQHDLKLLTPPPCDVLGKGGDCQKGTLSRNGLKYAAVRIVPYYATFLKKDF